MRYIFIHGLGQTASSWDDTLSYMNCKGEVYCPELLSLLRGSKVEYGSLYKGFFEYCGGFDEPLTLCGLSLGAVLTLNYAADNPGKVGSLALIAPQYKTPGLALRLQNIAFKLAPRSAFQGMGFEKKETIRLMDSMIGLDLTDKLENISVPTLIICGEDDKPNKKAAEELGSRLKNSRLECIDGAGHAVNADAPKKLAETLNAFYAALQK